jgi:acetyl-CoA carboxylase biotin carboxyl carrier protein
VTLTAADVAEILRLVEESSFDELSLELDGLKLNFKRGATGDAQAEQLSAAAAPGAVAAAGRVVATAPQAAAETARTNPPPAAAMAADPAFQGVRSPMLGTFYRAPKPGAPPYVTVGSAVEEGTIVGIIEVMKLMNTIRAQVRGTVAEILAADGALVEYGEMLLRVRKPD